ncbi:hypothetical protein [Candidatus Viridilinea mediisalina]|uniref:Uncharacterized protein n=1 Tax=Candidatus Viridilinea mediisalina TaxID=2024553 RepID=A0A2A6RHE5_9CHLR|nr:hypothetical protein [Candidatus Viridilinea mediisalina]PDW02270.1 hypothetical protein CJ255_14850 [Candidatus Viridilinea mediisalina]
MTTVEDALSVVRRLAVRDQIHLIARIAQEIANKSIATNAPNHDAWDALFATLDEIALAPLTSNHSATTEVMESRR